MKKKEEFRYLKIPYGENLLVRLGQKQIEEQKKMELEFSKEHFHNLMEISICRQGQGEIYAGHREYIYKRGDVLIIPRDFSHAIISKSEENSFWESVFLDPSMFLEMRYKTETKKKEQLLEEIELRPFLKSKQEEPALIKEVDLIMDQYRLQEYGYQECVWGLVYALLMEIVKINRKDYQKPEFENAYMHEKTRIIGAAMSYIEKNYAKDLRMSDISQAVFVSETHLRRIFDEYCAVSPMDYKKKIRINHACELLRMEDFNINEVAYKVGYSNMSTFINHFKEITGETPKHWKGRR